MTRPSAKNRGQGSGDKGQNSFLSAIDLLTLVFCGWIAAYMSAGILRAPEAVKHLPVYVAVAVGVLVLAWLQKQKGWIPASSGTTDKKAQILLFFRSIYPMLLFGYFYSSSHVFNRIIITNWLDPLFMGVDKSIFGYYPSLSWGQTYSHWAWQELFHFAYFCYYPMIFGLPIYLYFKQKAAFKELIFNLTFVFYLCYTIYSFLPVIGGRFFPEAMELTKTYRAGLFTHIMVYIYRTTTHLGGAFPSSHVAVTIVLTVAALRFVRKLGYLFVVIAIFLSVATVFCHYHWFIDAVAGIFTGVAGYYLANYVRSQLAKAGFN